MRHGLLMDAYAAADRSMHIIVKKPLCTVISDCREAQLGAQLPLLISVSESRVSVLNTVICNPYHVLSGIPSAV